MIVRIRCSKHRTTPTPLKNVKQGYIEHPVPSTFTAKIKTYVFVKKSSRLIEAKATLGKKNL